MYAINKCKDALVAIIIKLVYHVMLIKIYRWDKIMLRSACAITHNISMILLLKDAINATSIVDLVLDQKKFNVLM